MKRPLCSMLAVAFLTAAAAAQNQASVEQLQIQYNDALTQLKAAQDRKNELAAENAKLQKRAEDAEKQLEKRTDQLDALQDRDYFLREHYSAWEQFIDQNTSLRAMWFAFFSHAGVKDRLTDLLGDGKWPFSIND